MLEKQKEDRAKSVFGELTMTKDERERLTQASMKQQSAAAMLRRAPGSRGHRSAARTPRAGRGVARAAGGASAARRALQEKRGPTAWCFSR